MGALESLAAVMACTDCPSAQASAVWAIGSLVSGITEIQDEARNHILPAVVNLLGSPFAQVQQQAANAIYNLCARNNANQTIVAQCYGINKLLALLQAPLKHSNSMEKVLAAILCLVVKHVDNQRLVAAHPHALKAVTALLSSLYPRVQGLAAGLIRVVVVDQPKVQCALAAQGAIAALLHNIASPTPDKFVQEQALAALFNVILKNVSAPNLLPPLFACFVLTNVFVVFGFFFAVMSTHQMINMTLLEALEPLDALKRIACNTKSASSALAQTCAIMTLHAMAAGAAVTDEAPPSSASNLFTKLHDDSVFTDALLALAHSSQPSPRLRQHAERLLFRMLTPAEWAGRAKRASATLLDMLQSIRPIPSTTHDAAAQPPCCICLEPPHVHDDSSTAPPLDVVYLPCFHTIHRQCLQKWFNEPHAKDACPSCAAPVLANIYTASVAPL
jgi:hypothetical protein